ncbi:hypothetical protein Nlim_0095 [Candidatus Nitrosarchaeum limnium SFB1]|jgi:hypothetical protein|uniref:Uncharacterized protein n=1 Tax=Candidatus Nitrosarchaeum limnium SFB1 TaxID=886738 RepID=F3KI04_9ARCH|nr:hypothetical protein Nlim_0095 [Candidatus Nitrosarchaeum limnium SFB1]
MNEIDRFFANSVESIISENLGHSALSKIKSRLSEKFGIGIYESLAQFSKFDIVLREFFGKGADSIERKCFESILLLDSKSMKNNGMYITIKDNDLSMLFLETFGDEMKKNMINCVTDKSMTIYEILQKCDIPQTSGYRKIKQLIENNFLTIQGFGTSSDGKKIPKYTSVFENIKIDIEKNKVLVSVKIKKDFQDSDMLEIMQTLK